MCMWVTTSNVAAQCVRKEDDYLYLYLGVALVNFRNGIRG